MQSKQIVTNPIYQAYIRLAPILWEIAFFWIVITAAGWLAPAHLDGTQAIVTMLGVVITGRCVVLLTGWLMGVVLSSVMSKRQ